MGWWKVATSDAVIGDLPLDAIGAAVSRVLAEYQQAFQRRPTKAEWEALLRAVLASEEDRTRPLDVGFVKQVSLTVE
jgi:hypothetical protein